VKSFGARLPKCPARSFHKRASEHIPEALWPALEPILEQIGSLTQRIGDYERKLEEISKAHYPETQLLRQVEGIGPLTALTFLLSLEDPYRFEKSRTVGAYLGLVPAREHSGDSDPHKRIFRTEGNEMLRKLLLSSAHYILGPFGSDSDLRRHGEKIASRGSQELKETGGGGRGQEACAATTQLVDQRGVLRAPAQHPPLRSPGSLKEGAKL
jgi:transposase